MRRLISLLGAAVLGASLGGQTPRHGRALPGYAYTVRITGGQSAHGAAGAPPTGGDQNYTGRAVAAAARGRLDIIEGSADELFQQGDYLLFDTVDVIIVHPAKQEFIPVPRQFT